MVGLFAAVLDGLLAAWARWGKRRRQRLLNTIEVIILPDVTASRLGNKQDIRVYLPPRYRKTKANNLRFCTLMMARNMKRLAFTSH